MRIVSYLNAGSPSWGFVVGDSVVDRTSVPGVTAATVRELIEAGALPDEAAVAGGAVVFLPAGRYLVAGRLVVKEGVTLRGDWCPPSEGRTPETTILMLTAGRGEADGPATITTERGSGLRELTIWYPEQNPASIVPYPWTIRTSESATGDNTTIYNATLVNPYQAVRIGPEWNELHTLRNVYATALRCGVSIDTTTDIGRLIDVDFGPEWWETSGLFGAPTTDEARQALRSALLSDAVAIDMEWSERTLHPALTVHALHFVFLCL